MESLTDARSRRLAVLSLASLGLVLVTLMPILLDTAEYLGLLCGIQILMAFYSAVRLWAGDHFGARTMAISLALGGLAGQTVNSTVGFPGATDVAGAQGPRFWLLAVLEVLTVALLALASRPRPNRTR